MSPAHSRRLLQAVLVVLGGVATGTGGAMIALGAEGFVPGAGPTSASVDSELRFYAVWWAALGPILWRAVPNVEREDPTLRAACALTMLGGVARLLATRSSGRPHPLFQGLTVFELVAPPLLLAWQRSVRATGPRP